MLPRRKAIGTKAAALFVILVIVIAALVAVASYVASPAQKEAKSRLGVNLVNEGSAGLPVTDEAVTITAEGSHSYVSGGTTNSSGELETSDISPGAYEVSFVFNDSTYGFVANLTAGGATTLDVNLPDGGYQELNCGTGTCTLAKGVTQASSGPCLEGATIPLLASYADNGTRPGEAVLVMPDNATAFICVSYTLSSAASNEQIFTLTPWAGVGQVNRSITTQVSQTVTTLNNSGGNSFCRGYSSCLIASGGYSSFLIGQNSGVWVVEMGYGTTTYITLLPGETTTVVYTVEASPFNETSFYLVIPYLCPAVPLSVGGGSQVISSSVLPGASLGPISCPASQFQTTLVSVSGASLFYMGY